jgi:two-component system chemotaxis response regulator CheB
MNGLDVLAAIRASGQMPTVIMLSALTVKGGQMTIRALEAGAFDFITKPEGGSEEENLAQLRSSLKPMIQALARQREIRSILKTTTTAGAPSAPPVSVAQRAPGRAGSPIVLIGVSTGGPTALAEVLPALPLKIGAPIFIVQHMPPLFTEALAQRLQAKSAIKVKEAQDGETAHADCAYLAPGGRQMKVAPGKNGEITIRITDDPPENACRPSVDYLFRSVALHFPMMPVATQAAAETTGVVPEEFLEPIRPIDPLPHLSPKKISLGQKLFHDPRLSSDNRISCATCHILQSGGTDRKARSTGIHGFVGTMNAPAF